MLSFDTNIAVHAANTTSPLHQRAYDFIASLGARGDVGVCELMLVELTPIAMDSQQKYGNNAGYVCT